MGNSRLTTTLISNQRRHSRRYVVLGTVCPFFLIPFRQWVARLADWPAILQSAYRSRESTQEKADLPALTATDLSTEQRELWKDLQAAWSWNRKGHVSYWHKLLQLIEGVAWQLCWMRCTRGDPQGYGDKLQAVSGLEC